MTDIHSEDFSRAGRGTDDSRQTDSALARRTVVVVGVTLALVILVTMVWYAIDAFLLFFAATLVAILLRGVSKFLARLIGVSERWSMAGTVVILLTIIGLIGWFLGTRIESQVDHITQAVEKGFRHFEEMLGQTSWGSQWLAQPGGALNHVFSGDSIDKLGTAFFSYVVAPVDFVLILFLGFYFAIDHERYINGMVCLIPPDHRPRTRMVIAALGRTLGWWLVGRLLSMVEIAVVTSIALWLVGVPMPFALGLLTGVMNFVPNVGPIVATALAALVALTVSPTLAAFAVLTQVVVGGFDGFVVTPLIQQRTASIPAGLVLGSQLLAGFLMGPLGLFLATPMAAAAVVLVQKVYLQDVLGEPCRR